MKTIDADIAIGFLFDLDGVLIDSEEQYTRIWEEIEECFPTGVENFARVIKGTTLDNILSTYYPDSDTQKEVRKLLAEKEETMTYGYTPGAAELLQNLSDRGEKAVLVTSSNRDKMNILRRQIPEMENRFIAIVTGDKVTRSKPHPEGYLLGAGITGAHPRNCVVFEDSMQGVKAGQSAGCYVIGVAGTYPAERLAEYSDTIVDNLLQIDIDNLIKLLKAR